MLELLGVGITRRDGSWLVRGASARIDQPALILVTGDDADARRALLDAIAGDVIPAEGRVWLGGIPVTPLSRARIRTLIRDVDLGFATLGQRSVLTHVAAGPPARWPGLRAAPRREDRQRAQLALERVGLAQRAEDPVNALPMAPRILAEVAHALARRSEFLLLREAHAPNDTRGMESVATLLRRVVSTDRVTIVASASPAGPLQNAAHVTVTLTPDAARVVVV